jgi:hypothetical protein
MQSNTQFEGRLNTLGGPGVDEMRQMTRALEREQPACM